MTALIERIMLRGPHGSVILDQSTTAQLAIIIRDTDNGQVVGLFADSPASLIGIRPEIYPHQGYSLRRSLLRPPDTSTAKLLLALPLFLNLGSPAFS